jgi:iron(III) transport system permease protein
LLPSRRFAGWGSEPAIFLALLLTVCVLAALPMARLAIEGVLPRGRADAVLEAVLGDRETWTATWHTLVTGVLGTLISLALGVPAAIALVLTDIRGKAALVFAFMLPLLIPPQIIAAAWIELFGPASPILRPLGLAPRAGAPHPLYGGGGVSLLLGVEHAPLVFLALNAGLRALPRELLEAAQAAGASFWRCLWNVALPLSAPALAAGASLAFISAIGNFGTPALLGIPGRYPVLTTLIYQKLAGFGPTVLSEVADLSLILAVIAVLGLLAQGWLGRRHDTMVVATSAPPRVVPLGRWRLPAELGCWAGLTMAVLLPLASLLAVSFETAYGVPLHAGTATLANYRYILFHDAAAGRAAINSLFLAGSAALLLPALALPLGLFIAWRGSRLMRFAGLLAELPYALPGVVLAIACILVFIRPLPILGVSLYNTIWIMLVAYLARFLTLALRTVTAGYRQLDRVMEEAAQMAGAGFLRRLEGILAPLLAPSAIAGAILVFLTALNELTLSILLWSSGHETLGIVVFSLEQGGDNLSAAALAVLTVAATIALMLLAGRLARRLPRGALPWQV